MLWESEAKRIILPGVSKRGFTECQIAVQAVKDECVCTLVCVHGRGEAGSNNDGSWIKQS